MKRKEDDALTRMVHQLHGSSIADGVSEGCERIHDAAPNLLEKEYKDANQYRRGLLNQDDPAE